MQGARLSRFLFMECGLGGMAVKSRIVAALFVIAQLDLGAVASAYFAHQVDLEAPDWYRRVLGSEAATPLESYCSCGFQMVTPPGGEPMMLLHLGSHEQGEFAPSFPETPSPRAKYEPSRMEPIAVLRSLREVHLEQGRPPTLSCP